VFPARATHTRGAPSVTSSAQPKSSSSSPSTVLEVRGQIREPNAVRNRLRGEHVVAPSRSGDTSSRHRQSRRSTTEYRRERLRERKLASVIEIVAIRID